MKKIILLTSFLSFLLNSCQVIQHQKKSPNQLYQQSIIEAMSPDSSKICFDLISINKTNPSLVWKTIDDEEYLLMLTWKGDSSFYNKYIDNGFYNTGEKYPLWVTVAPQLSERMKKEKYKNPDIRLKQLLGLPPTSTYNYFIEFWIKPNDLFRPCPDKEITDSTCDLCFSEMTDSSHIDWINDNRITRYYDCDLSNKYPWTQLGYTYDWNSKNKSHIGLSEFVIKNNKKIVVNAIYTTEEYLKK